MAVICVAIWMRNHPRNEVAFHLGAERASDAAISAGGDDAVLGLAKLAHGFFHQRRGRTRLYARTARYAFGGGERLLLSRRNYRGESAAVDRERERPLDFLARADASRAHDALRRIESEIRIRFVLVSVEVIRAWPVAHFAEPDCARHV